MMRTRPLNLRRFLWGRYWLQEVIPEDHLKGNGYDKLFLGLDIVDVPFCLDTLLNFVDILLWGFDLITHRFVYGQLQMSTSESMSPKLEQTSLNLSCWQPFKCSDAVSIWRACARTWLEDESKIWPIIDSCRLVNDLAITCHNPQNLGYLGISIICINVVLKN